MYRGNHGRIEINEVIGTIAAPARCPVTPHPAEWSAHETACHSPKQVNFRTSPVNAATLSAGIESATVPMQNDGSRTPSLERHDKTPAQAELTHTVKET